MKTQHRIATVVALALGVFAFAVHAGPRETLEEALHKVAATASGSAAEASAMEQAIAAAQALRPPPATPDQVVEYVGRAKAAIRAASTTRDFLDAAEAYGAASRQAPWVGEYHFMRGLMLEKAEQFDEAQQAYRLYLLAAPQASNALEVRERMAGLGYLKEKAARSSLPATSPWPTGLYYNDADFQTASTTTLMGHATITALLLSQGRLTCGTFNPPNPQLQRPVGFMPYRDGQFEMTQTSVSFDGSTTAFCHNVRWCPTGSETGYRTGISVSGEKDKQALRVRTNNCVLKPGHDLLNWHPAP